MRRFLLGVLWLFVVLAVLSVGAAQILHFDNLKPRAEALASEALGEPVTIHGTIKIGLIGWRPSGVFRDVTVGKDLRAERVEVTPLERDISRGLIVHISGAQLSGRALGDYEMPIHLAPEGFAILGLRGEHGNTRLTGDVRYVGEDFSADLFLQRLPLGLFLEEATGQADLRADVRGKGLKQKDILRTLEGRFLFSSGDGKLTSRSLNLWARGLMQILLPIQKKETRLNCAVADFSIKNGVAHSKALIVDTSDISIVGKGSANLVGETVDFLLKPKPKGLTPVSLATPVRVQGPVRNVRVTPETKGMVKKMGGLLLGAVNPALLLLPVLEDATTADYNSTCVSVMKKEQQAEAPAATP